MSLARGSGRASISRNPAALDAAPAPRNHPDMNDKRRDAAIFVKFSLQRAAVAIGTAVAVLAIVVACLGIGAGIALACVGAGAASIATRP